MAHRIHRVLSVTSFMAAVVLMTPAVWSQNQNQYDADEQRAERNNPGSQQYDRPYNERDAQRDMRDRRRDDQYNDRTQEGRFGDRGDGRENTYSGDDQSWAERRQDRRDQRGNEDGPAGLGVMLDSSDGVIEVREVARRSPAARAGIERGDQIVSVNGRQITSPQQLTQMIRQEEPGSQVDIRIRRDGQQQTVTAELESLRDALDTLERGRIERGQGEEEFYSNSPPWSDDELMQHVNQLERQVDAMREQIEDLRNMLDNDPSQQRFSQRNERDSRFRD
jgi:C-terminal processing protease CtpA/Prc